MLVLRAHASDGVIFSGMTGMSTQLYAMRIHAHAFDLTVVAFESRPLALIPGLDDFQRSDSAPKGRHRLNRLLVYNKAVLVHMGCDSSQGDQQLWGLQARP